MKVGIWFYGLGTALIGILDIAWGSFDPSHQPIKALGQNVPGEHLLALAVGVWLAAAGLAMLWRRSARIGAAATATACLCFVALYLVRCSVGIHAHGWRIGVLSIAFGLSQQLFLIAPTAIVFVSIASTDSRLQARAGSAARWLLGLPPIVFGALHLMGLHLFASIVPPWIPYRPFWAGFTGIAFLLAGVAICSGIKDVVAARLLALMLLLFEGLVEVPPIFIRLHNQATWGAAVYNLAATGACLIFAEFFASRAERQRIDSAESAAIPLPNRVVA